MNSRTYAWHRARARTYGTLAFAFAVEAATIQLLIDWVPLYRHFPAWVETFALAFTYLCLMLRWRNDAWADGYQARQVGIWAAEQQEAIESDDEPDCDWVNIPAGWKQP